MKTNLLLILFLLNVYAVAAHEPWNPVANPKAIVLQGNVRFTVLTPEMIRMEWDSTGAFCDDAS